MQSDVAPFRAPGTATVQLLPDPAAGSIVARIRAHAVESDKVAVVDGIDRLTFKQLDRRSNQLARHLAKLGIGPEVCVALFLERSTDFIVAALAVLKAGGAYLPLDSSTPSQRVSHILADAGAPVLICHRGKSAGLPGGNWRVVELDGSDQTTLAAESDEFETVDAPKDQLAYVIYTSGSTGQPKGVEITHGNLLNLIAWHQRAFAVTAADRASQVAGLGFDAAGWEIWPHLTAGASVYIADEITRRSPQRLHDWLLTEEITVSFVPTILAEQLLHLNWPTDAKLRVLLTGADRLHRRPITGLPFTFYNNYGPTECTVVATSGVVYPEEGADGIPTIGQPILNTTALILDASLVPVTTGEPGELCLGGALVGRGYRNMPETTASRFIEYRSADGTPLRIYRTGDRVRMLPNGQIAFLGRLDDQVKIRGYRIELGEIISCLDRFPGIEASVVVSRESAGGPILVAYVVARDPGKLFDRDVREFLAARLPDYMIPAQFVRIESLPLTSNGKVDTAALPVPEVGNQLAKPVEGNDSAAAVVNNNPGDSEQAAVEARIATIVAGLLGQPTIGHGDNFFLIGGHSMLGVQVVARIRDAFGVKLTLRQLFGAPTVLALAAEVLKLGLLKNG